MAEHGVLMTTVTLGSNLTEKAMAVPLGAARTTRDEIFRATFAGVDWVEGINQSSFKIVRETLQRMDKLSQEAVDGVEAVASSVSRVIRGSGEAAGELVAKTAAALAGTKETSPRAAIAATSA
jgi:hypothetical protein